MLQQLCTSLEHDLQTCKAYVGSCRQHVLTCPYTSCAPAAAETDPSILPVLDGAVTTSAWLLQLQGHPAAVGKPVQGPARLLAAGALQLEGNHDKGVTLRQDGAAHKQSIQVSPMC